MNPATWFAGGDAPAPALVIAKWTLLLALAWIGHALLAGRNPRWRVLLWRGTATAIPLITLLSLGPPLVTWEVPAAPPIVAEAPTIAPPPLAEPSTIAPAIIAESPASPPTVGPLIHELAPIESFPATEQPTMPPPDEPERATDLATTIGGWLLGIWALGTIALSLRLALGMAQLAGIARRATPAPEEIARATRRIAGSLGIKGVVAVRCTSEIASPCLAGAWRPVLLLPLRPGMSDAPDELEAILAHELCHVRGRDLLWNNILHLTSIPLWFHPLAWRIRSAHAAACEGISDAVAAAHLGDPAGYGRALARLALRVADAPPPAQGMAMARTSDVRRRIQALNRRVFSHPLPRRLAMPATFAALLLASLLGGLGAAAPAEPPPDEPVAAEAETPKAEGRIALRVVADETGGPIEGVEVSYFFRKQGNPEPIQGKVVTDKDGRATIERPEQDGLTAFNLTARKPKHAPFYLYWDGTSHPIEIPAEKELRLARGTTIGGIVRDEDGKPIAGASIEVSMPAIETNVPALSFGLDRLKTGADGRWQVDIAPPDLSNVSVTVRRDGYMQGGSMASRDLDSEIALKKGFGLAGRVLDEEGRPIAGAVVIAGLSLYEVKTQRGSTNERGEFSLENCAAGKIPVIAQAQGRAPELKVVAIEEKAEPLEFRLAPAAVLKGKVVDRQGAPIAGAGIYADSWRGQQLLRYQGRTDDEGRFLWESAPRDAVTYSAAKDGYMRREVILAADGEEHAITLDPVLTLSGKVTDAATGKPIPRFRLIPGFQFPQHGVDWSYAEAAEFAGGEFTIRRDDARMTHFLKIEAAGYAPYTSREFKADEGTVALGEIALRPSAGLSGSVVLPDGKPASGVEVVLATREGPISLRQGRFEQASGAPKVTTSPDGSFTFPEPDGPFLLIALGDFGYADATPEEFARDPKLSLRPWGKIRGMVKIGSKSAPGEEMFYREMNVDRRRWPYIRDITNRAAAGADGHFTLDRVIPGRGYVARMVVVARGGGSATYSFASTPVEVEPGATPEVQVGGVGRPVIGRAVPPKAPDWPINWTGDWPAEAKPKLADGEKEPMFAFRHIALPDKEGRFRIEDVPPGAYTLRVPLNASDGVTNARVGEATADFTVPGEPGGRSDEPLDLGDLPVKLDPLLEPGEFAPEFTAKCLDGSTVNLKDLRGKVVLLDFWASYGGTAAAEAPNLEAIHDAFGKDPRFAQVSLSCDRDIETARRGLAAGAAGWTQALGGNIYQGIAREYKVRVLPSTFVIGPDGRVRARNLRGNALRDAIRDALADEKSFADAATAAHPARFPVTRFDEKDDAAAPAEPPAIAILDNADRSLEPDRPHKDGLRLLTAGGRTIRARQEFHLDQSIGGLHRIATDPARGRLYLAENGAGRITALDLRGRKLWQAVGIQVSALAVDPETGHIWAIGGDTLDSGQIVVLDGNGGEVAVHPVRGFDIAHDPHSGGFWIVGRDLAKLDRDGKVLFQRRNPGWAYVSVAPDPRDGSAWVVERDHPDAPGSKDRLWRFAPDGSVAREIDLSATPAAEVACDPKTGVAWVPGEELLRFDPDGRPLPPLPIQALGIAASPATGAFWVATQSELLQLGPEGKPQARFPLDITSRDAWLAAF